MLACLSGGQTVRLETTFKGFKDEKYGYPIPGLPNNIQ